ncbi:MAG: hypothetical protein AB1482_05800 [Pseudomonadota bacterium]
MKTEHAINLNDDPKFAEASTLLEKLKAELKAVEDLVDKNYLALSEPAMRRSKIEEQAHAMLAGQSDAALKDIAEASRIRAELESAQLKRPALHRAIEIQRQTVENIRAELHNKICRELAPKHAELVREIVKRLIDLDAALTAEADLRDEIFQGTGLHGLTPMPVGNLGLLRYEYSVTASYLIECATRGFLKKSELPEHLRGRVPSQEPAKAIPNQRVDSDGWLHATA